MIYLCSTCREKLSLSGFHATNEIGRKFCEECGGNWDDLEVIQREEYDDAKKAPPVLKKKKNSTRGAHSEIVSLKLIEEGEIMHRSTRDESNLSNAEKIAWAYVLPHKNIPIYPQDERAAEKLAEFLEKVFRPEELANAESRL